MPTRHICNIEVAGETRETFRNVHLGHGMTHVEAASRLFEWFADQDAMVQAAILRQYPQKYRAEILKLALKRMAKRD